MYSPGIMTNVYPYRGYCATDLQKSQKVRVRVWGYYRTYRSSGYGTEVLHNSQMFWVLWHGRTKLTEVSGRYAYAVPLPRVFVALVYETYRSSRYGYELRSKLTQVPGMG